MQVGAEVYQQETVVAIDAKIADYEGLFRENGSIQTAALLLADCGILPPEMQQFFMELVYCGVALALAQVEL